MSVEKSQLISDEENKRLTNLIDDKSKILACTVARLYQARNGEWIYAHTGVLTLTKDSTRKKYLLQIYNMDNLCLAWEYILGMNFVYNVYKRQIHTFNADDLPSLLSFASFEESNKFSDEMISTQNQRRELKARKRQSHVTSKHSSGSEMSQMTDIKPVVKLQPKGSIAKKGKISKSDISNPSNFRHVDHMGLKDHFFSNPNDENLKNFLKKNHMENLLTNEEEIRGIYDFIDQRGGLEKLESEMKQQQQQQQQQQLHMRKAPPVPQKNPPPPPDRFHNVAPPNQNYRPPPPGPIAPPPPPTNHMAPPPPPTGVGVPPPPPPPPPPAPAPPPAMVIAKPTAHSSVPASQPGKGGLLAEIEKFDAKKLKTRTQNDVEDAAPAAPVAGGSLLDSLAQYLVQRKNLITGTSDSEDDDNDDEDDEEWKE